MSELISTGKKDASATQTQLDGLVVNIELTLIIEGNGHVIIALVQMAGAFAYLLYVMRFFIRIVPLIVETRQEWREDTLE